MKRKNELGPDYRRMMVEYLKDNDNQQPRVPDDAGPLPAGYAPQQPKEREYLAHVPPHLRNLAAIADFATAGGVEAYGQGVSPVRHLGNTLDRTLKMGADIAGELSLAYPTARSSQEFARGNYAQGVRELTPHALTVATAGVAPALNAVGRVAGKAVPGAQRAYDTIASMPGLKGTAARTAAIRAPIGAVVVGATEGTKNIVNSTAAMAETGGSGVSPPPQVNFRDPASIRNLQEFLASKGFYSDKIDGSASEGGPTRRALSRYMEHYEANKPPPETPEERAARIKSASAEAAEREAKARLAAVEAGEREVSLKNSEVNRRKKVLADAQNRFDNRDKPIGTQVTETIQNWAPTAIMGGALASGLLKIPVGKSSGNKTAEIDKLASRLIEQGATPAQRSAYIRAYDNVAKAPYLDKTDKLVGGGLAAEIALSEGKLYMARNEYQKAMEAFESAVNQKDKDGRPIQLDGAKESELADRVVRAKNDLEKWSKLSGAGQHGLAFYSLGAKGIAAPLKERLPKPGSEANFLRQEYDDKTRLAALRGLQREDKVISGLSLSQRKNPLDMRTGGLGPEPAMKDVLPPKVSPPIPAAVDRPAAPSAPAAKTTVKAEPKKTSKKLAAQQTPVPAAPAAKGKKNVKPVETEVPGTGDIKPVVKRQNLTPKKKQEIAELFIKNNGITADDALKVYPSLSKNKVEELLQKMERFKKDGMSDHAIRNALGRKDISSIAGIGIGAGLAAGSFADEDYRRKIVEALR